MEKNEYDPKIIISELLAEEIAIAELFLYVDEVNADEILRLEQTTLNLKPDEMN